MTWSYDANRARRGLVLVVDDAPDMRELIEDLLTEEGYEVVTAASGGHALGVLAARIPDLVITDLLMPGMDGFALRAEMLRRPELADVPVIVLSSFWQRPSETLDAVEVIGKPLDLERLLSAVERATAPEHRPSRDVEEQGEAAATRSGRDRQETAPQRRRRDARRVQQEA
jgi:CheY-like chemotaxis protein